MSTRRLAIVDTPRVPAYVVWELTLRCDQRCTFCGSRADDPRDSELTTEDALAVADQLADAGAREVVLIGGEAYLHDGVYAIIARLRDRGVVPVMTTGGRGLDRDRVTRLADAGLARASVSIDGLAPTHDVLRASPGSHAAALAALANLRAAGIEISANTNINRCNRADLEPLFDILADAGIRAWQVQITAPLGRAADRPDMILQPWDLLDLLPRIAALKRTAHARGILLMPGNNLGYFGPEEAELRSLVPGTGDRFAGCQAGRFVLGIESDGAVKGCPSLQTSAYVVGNLRAHDLATLWSRPEIAAPSSRTAADLWGFCGTCVFASECLGGCTFTAHSVLGRPGNNPYCHFRARTLAARGIRERLVPAARAPGRPFDHGRFTIVQEPVHAPDPDVTPQHRLRSRATSLPLAE